MLQLPINDIQLRIILPPIGNILRRLLLSPIEDVTPHKQLNGVFESCSKCQGLGYQPFNVIQKCSGCLSPFKISFSRFSIISKVGNGSHSVTFLAIDSYSNRQVAIKISNLNCFDIATREFTLLRWLSSQKNGNPCPGLVCFICSCFLFPGYICIVQELLSPIPPFVPELFKNFNLLGDFISQILQGLQSLHSFGIVHGDLKPDNLMHLELTNFVNLPLRPFIIDLGNSITLNEMCYLDSQCPIQSVLYRAPEVMTGLSKLTPLIDMWSFGCIIFEFMSGKPFLTELQHSDYSLSTFCKVLRDLYSKPIIVFLSKALNTQDYYLIDFISRLLDLDPLSRLSSKEALGHPFIRKYSPSNYISLTSCSNPRFNVNFLYI